MKAYQKTALELFEFYQTTERGGLSESDIPKRQQEYGKNEIQETGGRAWWMLFLKQFKSTLILILFLAAVISLFTGHEVDAYLIVAVILINTFIGFLQEWKAEKAVASLKSYLKTSAKVIRDGVKKTVAAAELVPGDIIILEEGDSIPADARLFLAKNLRAIEAPLTGESLPVNKLAIDLPEELPLADRKNTVYKGTFISGGYGRAIVTGTGMKTALGEIAHSLDSIKHGLTNFQKKTNELARQMGFIALISALTLFTVAYFIRKQSLDETLMIAIAALVSSIPEGLPAVLAIVLAIGAHNMSKQNAIVREFSATETLGAVTTIITDKTGTLTQNTLTVRKVMVSGETPWEISGEGWSPIGNFHREGNITEIENQPTLQALLRVAAFSNNSDIRHDTESDTYQLVGDPTEGALLALARKGGVFPKKQTHCVKVDDLPFSATLKMRATLIQNGAHKEIFVIGAPERILDHCTSVAYKNTIVHFEESVKEEMRKQIEQWSGDAMRVIALAKKETVTSHDQLKEQDVNALTFLGIAGMIDPPRPDVKEAVDACHKAGIRVIMATGDHINTGIAIAKATHIISENDHSSYLGLTETQLQQLDEKEFEKAIMETRVFARLTPQMKLRIATTLQAKGELIAMTGDGVNDAPALKKADVGVAMGIMGTDVARDAAQVVLADDNFSTIVKAIQEGRVVFNNVRQTSFFLLTTNFSEVVTLLSAIFMGLPIPLTATQILWLNLVTDGTCTTTMATEKGHGDELEQAPMNPKEKILNKSVIPFLLINAVLMATLTLSVFNYYLPEGIEKARTAAFVVIAFCQLFNMFNMRSIRHSAFTIGLFSNKWVNIGLIISITIQVMIIEIPFFAELFHFNPISFIEFLVFAALASSILWMGELYKVLYHLRYGKKM
ncbi:cation-translocating P-type ATPase [Flavobacterium lacus]|uniref:Ca2+-transporting ATPase n=1 Tax=Flavobacterium lacus TaxID=1353778 RepID=A0A328WXP5_9FLAO|nr:HAD-IC family P-type ATPase [Flavobacterium lacus]RAR47639.1 Ca2+-transporting ATPase [Flavobacterium lacus]